MHLRFPPRPGRLVARALLTAAVAGCSAEATDDRNGSQEARTAATDALPEAARAPGCELITAAEITAATGKVPARAEWDDTNLRGCSWYDADGSPILGLTIGAAPRTYEDYLQSVREQTEEMASLLEGVDTSTVAGIGDYAIWHETEGASYLNAARDGELFMLMIFTEPEGGRTKRQAVLELASKGVPRM